MSETVDRCSESSSTARTAPGRLRLAEISTDDDRTASEDPVDGLLKAATTDLEGPGVVVGECPLQEGAQRPRKPSFGHDDLVVDDLDPVGPLGERVPNRAVHGKSTAEPEIRVDDDDVWPIQFYESYVPDQLVWQTGPDAEMGPGADGDLVVGLGGLEARLPPRWVVLRVTQDIEHDVDRALDEPPIAEPVHVS